LDSLLVVPGSDLSSLGWPGQLSWKLGSLSPHEIDLSGQVVASHWKLDVAVVVVAHVTDSVMVVISGVGAGDSGVRDGTWRAGPVRGTVGGPEKRKGVNTTLHGGSSERKREREVNLLV